MIDLQICQTFDTYLVFVIFEKEKPSICFLINQFLISKKNSSLSLSSIKIESIFSISVEVYMKEYMYLYTIDMMISMPKHFCATYIFSPFFFHTNILESGFLWPI